MIRSRSSEGRRTFRLDVRARVVYESVPEWGRGNPRGTNAASSVPRVTLLCAAIGAITATACSLGMTDLSEREDDGRTNGVATNGAPPAPADDAEETDAVLPDTKLEGAPPIAAPPMATGCQLVTFTPSSAQSAGGGQGWSAATNALADDGASSTAALSTDNRESALLVFGGFTGPAIPPSAVIKGLLVDVDRNAGGTCIVTKTVLATIGGAPRPRADATDPWQGVLFYGGVEDTWGGAIAPADLATATVSIQTRLVGTADECKPRDARIDTLRVRVHYCVN